MSESISAPRAMAKVATEPVTEHRDPLLLTPGPLTTSLSVKRAMLRDVGSRDHDFIDTNRHVRERLVEIVNGAATHVCVPLQGSGTFAVEAMLGTFVPPSGKVLVLVNGAYGKRMQRICEYLRRTHEVMQTTEDQPVDVVELDRLLTRDESITHVAVVHCETTSGILNPLEKVADVVASHCRGLLVDAMSAFGALPIDARSLPFDALVASSNKCLEGVPGVGFCIAREAALEQTRGNSPSLCMDLYDQWTAMEANGQWRFTPPTHCILAFAQALDELAAEGGVPERGRRYSENCTVLVDGMRAMGFQTLLPDALQAPIIVTFYMPADPAFDFEDFYERLRKAGFVIYPGKLTVADSFRIGCIGRLGRVEIEAALDCIRHTLDAMNVRHTGPPLSQTA